MKLRAGPAAPLVGTVRVPGDKSVTHRALILAAWAEGASVVHGANGGLDCRATARAVAALGATIEATGGWPRRGAPPDFADPPGFRVRGTAGRWREPAGILDLGNSGTGLRLLAGALAGLDGFAVLDGDRSLRRRPMRRITEPLRRMGIAVDGPDDGARAPLAVRGGRPRALAHDSPVASAQVKSALLLAALAAEGDTVLREPQRSRDHTERMLPLYGARVEVAGEGPATVTLRGPQRLQAADLTVPGDFSAAAFWIVAATLVPGSRLEIAGVGLNPTRTGLLEVLRRMGAAIEIDRDGEAAGEPVGRIRVEARPLRATAIAPEEVAGLVDEVPIWAVAAAAAEGESSLAGGGELRAKESDRLRGIARGLAVLGVEGDAAGDGLRVRGLGGAGRWGGGRVVTGGDHRLAMAFLVAGLAGRETVEVTGGEMVDTSYPGFYPTLMALVSSR